MQAKYRFMDGWGVGHDIKANEVGVQWYLRVIRPAGPRQASGEGFAHPGALIPYTLWFTDYERSTAP